MFLDERKFEGGEGLVLIDVADGRHEGTDDHLGVILEEVDLRQGEGMGGGGGEKGWETLNSGLLLCVCVRVCVCSCVCVRACVHILYIIHKYKVCTCSSPLERWSMMALRVLNQARK